MLEKIRGDDMSYDAEFGIIEDFDYDKDYSGHKELESGWICIGDEALDYWQGDFQFIRTYYYSYDRPGFGLKRRGVSLIPPKSLRGFLDIVLNDQREEYKYELQALRDLIIEAIERDKFIIHYGLT